MGILRDTEVNESDSGRGPIERITELSGRQTNTVSVVAVVLVALWTCFLAAPRLNAQAQTYYASLRGRVDDPQQNAVPGAKVTLTSEAQSFVRTFMTLDTGEYSFPLLPPGTYTLTVEKAGFEKYVQPGIVLGLGQSSAINVPMALGKVTQQVTVTEHMLILETQNANVSVPITARETLELPTNSGKRNPFWMARLNSSVNSSAEDQVFNGGGPLGGKADQSISNFNFGGSFFGTNALLIDGHQASFGDWGGLMYAPSPDEVQEVKVETNDFTAQYGFSMGNVMSLTTKSGTSQYHGDVYEFVGNEKLNANFFFNNRNGRPKPPFKQNQFGGSFGGPLSVPGLSHQRNRTFIFGLYEVQRQILPSQFTTTVPTGAFKQGDFSALLGAPIGVDALGRPVLAGQLYNPFTTRQITAGQIDPVTGLVATQTGKIRDPFPGNLIRGASIDTVAGNLTKFYPPPTNAALFNNLATSTTQSLPTEQYTVRVDHTISDKSRMFARWSQKFEQLVLVPPSLGTDNPGGPKTLAPDSRWDLGFNYSHVFSPTLVMSANFGWNRWAEGRIGQGVGFAPSSLGLPSFLDCPKCSFPQVSVAGVVGLGGAGFPSGASGFSLFPREIKNPSFDLTKTWGSHLINAGFSYINFHINQHGTPVSSFNFTKNFTQGPDPNSPNAQTGLGFASFLLGTGSTGGQSTLGVEPALAKSFYAWYLQDEWKVTPHLTINLGVRYDFQGAPTERFDRLSYFDPAAVNPISSSIGFSVPGVDVFTTSGNRGIYDAQKTNFAPRIGFAYQVRKRLVARGGAAIFYIPAWTLDNGRGGLNAQGFSVNTPYVGTVDGITPVNLISNPLPNGLVPAPGKSLGGLTQVGLNNIAIVRDHKTSYVEQWTFGLQYALSADDSLGVTYVGNHGVDLRYPSVSLNQLPPAALALGAQLQASVPNPFFGKLPSSVTSSPCGLSGSTVTRGQLLRPFPEFCNNDFFGQVGADSWYESAQAVFRHRFSQGLEFNASFTVSKFESETEGVESWAQPSAVAVRNFYNLSAEKSLDANDIPKSLVLDFVYELPFGKGKRFGNELSGPANAVLGGWQISTVGTFKDGFPLSISSLTNNTFSLGGGQRPNLVGDPHIANPTVDHWFNNTTSSPTAAFQQPPGFTFGNVGRYMPNLRAPGITNLDITIAKWWNFGERWRLQFRSAFFNAFNHANFYAPNTTFGDPAFGTITQTLPPRQIQLAMKLYF